MSIIEFNPYDKETELPVEEHQSNIPYLYLLPKNKPLPDLRNATNKSIHKNVIKLDTRSKTDKIIDKALLTATIIGLAAILWYLHETFGINDITTANIPEIMDTLSKIEPNILLNNTITKLGRLR